MSIVLFNKNSKSGSRDGCQLRDFINLLISNKVPRPFSFSHVDSDGILMDTLTLRENLQLELVTTSFHDSAQFSVDEYIQGIGNPYLMELYKKITLLDELPKNVDLQTKKITALIRGCVRKADYVFLEAPEKHLLSENNKLLISALEHRCNTLKSTAIVSSTQETMWRKNATVVVSLDSIQEIKKSDNKVYNIAKPSADKASNIMDKERIINMKTSKRRAA